MTPARPTRPRGALRSLVVKETRHILRDRRTLAVLLLMPLVQVLLFGAALRTDLGEVRLAVVDAAGDVRSRDLVARIDAGPAFRVVALDATDAALDRRLRRGEAEAALRIPPGFGADVARGRASLLVVTEGSDPNRSRTIEGALTLVVRTWERSLAADSGAPGAGRPPGVVLVPVVQMRFNPTMASENLFVPGLLAFVLTLVSALMTAITVARERETGTMEVLLVSPLRPVQIVAAKVAPYLVLAFLNAVTTLAVAKLAFDVLLRGSLVLLLAESALYVLVALGLGIFVSSRARDQRTAMIVVLLGLLLPTMMLSGFVFPISSLPAILRPLTNLIPTTWFIAIARGIMLKGVGIETLWKETLILAAMAVGLLAASARSLRERLD